METITEKIRSWLLPVLLILFVLQMVTLPHAAGYTFAEDAGAPQNRLVYIYDSLRWDKTLGVDPATGAVELGLFDRLTPDGRRVIAPGDSGSSSVRLHSRGGEITYTAVLYRIRTNEDIPVTPVLSAGNAAVTTRYILPDGISEDQVITAVTGKVNHQSVQDFHVSWKWDSQSDEQDVILSRENGQITVGLYIVVEKTGEYGSDPTLPQTGDSSHIGMYSTLMVISGLLLVLLVMDRRREEKELQELQEQVCQEQQQ